MELEVNQETALGTAESFSLKREAKEAALKFLDALPHKEVKEYVKMIEKQEIYTQKEISTVMSYFGRMPFYVVAGLMNILVEGIVPNLPKQEDEKQEDSTLPVSSE